MSPASPTLRRWIVGTALFLGTVALFSRALPYGFTNYDDPGFVTGNVHVQMGLTWESLRWAFTGDTDYWRPLTQLSHMLDWQMHGRDASGHRLTSILWHAANAVLVFFVARRLSGAFWTSAVCAALFAWHPLRVESVVWVAERKDVMSGFFFLLAILAHLAFAARRKNKARAAWTFYGLTLAAFVGGLMSKPMVVTLPLVLLALDFWPLRRFEPEGKRQPGAPAWRPVARRAFALLVEKVPFFALSAAASVVTVLMQVNIGGFTLDLPLGARLANAFVAIPRYLGKFFWPFDLAVAYPHPGAWPWPVVALAVLFVLGATAVAAWQWRRRPWLAAGWLWFLFMLLPVIGLVQSGFQSMADRYTYLPMLGWQIALLWTVQDLPLRRGGRRIVAVAASLVILACAARTWDQQKVWRDSVALFSHAVAVTERNDVGYSILASACHGDGRYEEAEQHARTSLAINPDNITANVVLARAHAARGRHAEARAAYREVLQRRPDDALTELELGLFELRNRRPAEARELFRSAMAHKPDSSAPHGGLAEVAVYTGDFNEALREYQAALALAPYDAALRNNFALLLVRLGRTAEAEAQFAQAVALDNTSVAAANFGDYLRATGRLAEAAAQYRRSLEIEPTPAGHVALGFVLRNLGRTAEAQAELDEALRLQPDYPAARVELGCLLFDEGRPGPAAEQFRAAATAEAGLAAAHLGLGRAEQALGRTEAAVASFERAVALEPGNPSAHRLLADALARQRRFAEAIASYRRAAEIQPYDAGTRAALGFALWLADDRPEAIHQWEEALRLDPAFPGLRERVEKARREVSSALAP